MIKPMVDKMKLQIWIRCTTMNCALNSYSNELLKENYNTNQGKNPSKSKYQQNSLLLNDYAINEGAIRKIGNAWNYMY
jgi:hypothetical protein